MNASPTVSRRYFLDWLRILAFALLVLYHVGMVYVTWPFHVKSPFASDTLEPWMKLSGPWRMSLLFFIAGAATAYMLARDGASRALLGSRARRLLIPLAFGMLVVVPPQSYVEVLQRHGYTGGFIDFMGLYLRGYGGFCAPDGKCLILPTWNHLWFLPYLMAYTALLWLLLQRRRGALDALAARARALPPLAAWLVVPLVWLLLTRVGLRPWFPVTHAFFDDVFSHAQFAAIFLAGAVVARAEAWPRWESMRWPALAAAALGYAGIISALPQPVRLVAVSLMQWCAVVAAVGFAHRHLNRDGRWRRVLADAVFPVYLLHQTVIVVAVAVLARWGLAPALEGPILVGLTFAACALFYLGVRRVAWLRPLVGLGPRQASGPVAETSQVTPKRSITMP